ncbi:hypothetical protein [Streptomyces anthocyanicus]|uniref:hypothetical protein n=1 Tax=Streptomyces anthocyanicus TaxID=68174 RepID=UPI00362FB2C5
MTVLRPGHGPAAPVRSAARHRLGTRLDALDPRVRRDVVRLLTLLALLALLPLLLLLARGAVRLPHAFDPLALYGLAVLAGTVCLLHLAYSRYDDPAVRPLRSRPRHAGAFPALPARPPG